MAADQLHKQNLSLQGEECHPSVANPISNGGASVSSTDADPETTRQSSGFPTDENNDDNETRNIYAYYRETLWPALASSFPMLFRQLVKDGKDSVCGLFQKTWTRVAPESLSLAWTNFMKEEALLASDWIHGNFTNFLLRNFDTNKDGHISASELLHVNTKVLPLQDQSQSWTRWFQCTWPLFDWKIGLFLWRTFGSFLLLVAVATIIPGRIHVLSGRILRWPVLLLTYLMIAAELVVYVLVRLFIWLAESTFTTEKHRRLRADMEGAKSYDEWYGLAEQLDISQGRDAWRSTVDDDTSCRYNWAFIDELIKDMREAREMKDYAMVIAVLQQCTRKNVGGVMSEDLFSFTNTGETKDIVKDFFEGSRDYFEVVDRISLICHRRRAEGAEGGRIGKRRLRVKGTSQIE